MGNLLGPRVRFLDKRLARPLRPDPRSGSHLGRHYCPAHRTPRLAPLRLDLAPPGRWRLALHRRDHHPLCHRPDLRIRPRRHSRTHRTGRRGTDDHRDGLCRGGSPGKSDRRERMTRERMTRMTKKRKTRQGDTISLPQIGEIEIDQLLNTQVELRDRHGNRLGKARGRDWLQKYL